MKNYAIVKCDVRGQSVDYSTAVVESLTDNAERASKMAKYVEGSIFVKYAVNNINDLKKGQLLFDKLGEDEL